ncbi:MAG: hypothetical protein EA402_12245 [Planctomycetota bacterium]|nr:MAG: hypothetical protein EA402_12245 [Planctomycetota bacterium]
MSPDPHCATCDGFGWIPETGPSSGWYRHNWRLILDPTLAWKRCPVCGAQSGLSNVQDCLARLLLLRVLQETETWQRHGTWWLGYWQGCDLWRDETESLLIIGPGPGNPHPWLLISSHGVMDHLSREAVDYHLQRMDRVPLPPAEDQPPSH